MRRILAGAASIAQALEESLRRGGQQEQLRHSLGLGIALGFGHQRLPAADAAAILGDGEGAKQGYRAIDLEADDSFGGLRSATPEEVLKLDKEGWKTLVDSAMIIGTVEGAKNPLILSKSLGNSEYGFKKSFVGPTYLENILQMYHKDAARRK